MYIHTYEYHTYSLSNNGLGLPRGLAAKRQRTFKKEFDPGAEREFSVGALKGCYQDKHPWNVYEACT